MTGVQPRPLRRARRFSWKAWNRSRAEIQAIIDEMNRRAHIEILRKAARRG